MSKIRGFTIIEFMIAISLGALLVVGASSIYLSNKQTFNLQYELSRLQENARYANYRLNQDIRMAGFLGCGDQDFVQVNNIVKSPPVGISITDGITGYDAASSTFSPALPSNLSGKTVNGSDIVEIRMGDSADVVLRDDMNRANNPVLVYDRLDIKPNDILIVSDCQSADIFRAGSASQATAITHTVNNNNTNNLSTAYTTDANLMRFLYFAYYIQDTGRTNSNNEPILALMRQDMNGNEDEIAEGVEQMQILYGVDNNNDNTADQYYTAAQVNALNTWNEVISVNIRLLFATLENVATQPESYTYNNVTLTPTDRKMRREWSTFINLRNRGLPS